jgi:hypothetical protein
MAPVDPLPDGAGSCPATVKNANNKLPADVSNIFEFISNLFRAADEFRS